jgi:hypothetical protein
VRVGGRLFRDADCLRLAQSVTAPRDRALLLEMAAGWQRMADRAERMNEEQSSERDAAT